MTEGFNKKNEKIDLIILLNSIFDNAIIIHDVKFMPISAIFLISYECDRQQFNGLGSIIVGCKQVIVL